MGEIVLGRKKVEEMLKAVPFRMLMAFPSGSVHIFGVFA